MVKKLGLMLHILDPDHATEIPDFSPILVSSYLCPEHQFLNNWTTLHIRILKSTIPSEPITTTTQTESTSKYDQTHGPSSVFYQRVKYPTTPLEPGWYPYVTFSCLLMQIQGEGWVMWSRVLAPCGEFTQPSLHLLACIKKQHYTISRLHLKIWVEKNVS